MANGHGGARTPRNPAPVSGPGRMSRRTDGGPQQTKAEMTGMAYGENADFQEIQAGAPMAAAPSATPARGRKGSAPSGSVTATPLFAPTSRPDEPITAGAPFGPGPGPSTPAPVVNARTTRSMADTLAQVQRFSNDPTLSRVVELLSRRGL